MRSLLTFMVLFCTLSLSAQEAILTGILDGDLLNAGGQGGNPKVIEIYVNGSVDLTGYQLSRTNAGNTFTFPAGSNYADEFVYVVNPAGEDEYLAAFTGGDFGNYLLSNQIVGNGNDPYQLLNSTGTVLDQTGGPIGTGNNYQDGHRYRVSNTGPDGGWVEANWTGGNSTVDGQAVTAYAGITMFGTYTVTPPGPSVAISSAGDLDEDGTDGGFTLTLSEMAAGNVTINYSLSGTATQGADYADGDSGSVTITAGQLSTTVDLTVIDDMDSEPTETVTLTITSISDMAFTAGSPATINVFDNEPISATPIHTIQGAGTSSALVGQTISIEGIVVADFQGGTGVGLGGFFVQEEDADADADPATSEGIWVFDGGTGTDVAVGDLVEVTGVVEESSDLTQLNVSGGGASVAVSSSNNTLPTAASLDMPLGTEAEYEAYEGMLTTITDDLYVTGTFSLGRFGEFEVSEGERLITFTECNFSDPAALAAYDAGQDLRRLVIDDGRSGDNNYPIILGDGMEVSATNTLRSGTVLTGMTGIVDERFTGYRFQATGFSRTDANPRPVAAPAVGGNVTVVSANVLNYFTTLGSRGADDANEFDRQEAKIVNALIELDADIVGLVEIENNIGAPNDALQTLITAIAAAGGPTYTAVSNPNSGSDQIMVALIYKADVVEESGTAANLASPAAVFSSNRIPLAQTFRVIEAGNPNFGQEVTVCVNHWKSKGGSCGAGDDDNGGAGSCNGTRDAAAQAIAAWMATNPTGVNEPDQLIIGDLNAYSQEDPLLTLEAAGFVNTVRALAGGGSFPCGSIPSYVFRGEWGSLDHVFATTSLSNKVTGSVPWQVNAAEPTALDYDTQFNNSALYADDFYRFSDHNPILVGLDLGATLPVELTSFTGELSNGQVELDWATSVEINTDRFVVERLVGSGSFTAIGEVMAIGNSNEPQAYSFTDTNPENGNNQYRLRIIDDGGAESFSNIVTVTVENTNQVAVVRNGVNTYRLSGAPVGSDFVLTNASGAIIKRGVVTAATEDIDGSGLPTGVYFLLVRDGATSNSFKIALQ